MDKYKGYGGWDPRILRIELQKLHLNGIKNEINIEKTSMCPLLSQLISVVSTKYCYDDQINGDYMRGNVEDM
jgi:hypothetical protein